MLRTLINDEQCTLLNRLQQVGKGDGFLESKLRYV